MSKKVKKPKNKYKCAVKEAIILKEPKIKSCDCKYLHEPLTMKVIYNFEKEFATLYFSHKDDGDFELKSLDVVYDFANAKALKIDSSPTDYSFSIYYIERHVLHKQFSCTIVCRMVPCNMKLKIKYTFDIPYFQTDTKIKLEELEEFEIPEEIKNLFPNIFNTNVQLSDEGAGEGFWLEIKEFDRMKKLRYALCIEDLTQQQALLPNQIHNVHLKRIKNSILRFKVNPKELPDSIDEINLQFIQEGVKESIKAAIDEIVEDEMNETWIEFTDVSYKLKTCTSYTVRFIPNDITFRACHKALRSINEKKLKEYFKEFEKVPQFNNTFGKAKEFFEDSSFIWCNKNIESNEEQKMAIKNIVNCTSFPYPYCVFGPPGTGKTSCVVECILQIMKLKSQSKILVTAQSNSACNEIGDRLLKFTSIRNVFRLYSSKLQKTNYDALSDELLPSSNLRKFKKHKKKIVKSIFPTMEELKHFPIVICTLTTSSQLDRVNLHNHFDYIFIDECAATTEPETYIPIVELGCAKSKVVANIVLIGDPKQLPPVVSAEKAMHLGLNVSLMERIMATARYLPNPSYDSKYITLLLDNYRSHHSILHFSNVEFYESKLRAKNKSKEVFIGTKWHKLPNKKFPVCFFNETTRSMMDKTSSYNDGQINVVVNYVNGFLKDGIGYKKIKPEDIGIVTPYKAQTKRLKKLLPKNVEVGTSEYYQGREKLIIIFSTVKSKCGIGFVKDERRLNVCLTRAKALLIVIGNVYTLKKNKLWSRFIDYCEANGGIFDPKDFKKRKGKTIPPKKDESPMLMINYEKTNDETKHNSKKEPENEMKQNENAFETDSIIDDRETDSDTEDAYQKLIDEISMKFKHIKL